MADILKVIALDKNQRYYRPEWRAFTGGTMSSIILSQALYWWERQGRRPFYKFKQPCEHPKYRKGDSWCEELGFTRTEFDTALQRISAKITTKEAETQQECPGHGKVLEYWVTMDRQTFFRVHATNLRAEVEKLYQNLDISVNQDSDFITDGKSANPAFPNATTKFQQKSRIPDLQKPCFSQSGNAAFDQKKSIINEESVITEEEREHPRSLGFQTWVEFFPSEEKNLKPTQRTLLDSITDIPLFRRACEQWAGDGYSGGKVGKLKQVMAELRAKDGKNGTGNGKAAARLSEEPPSSYVARPDPPAAAVTETPDEALQHFARQLELARQSYQLKGWAPERIAATLADTKATLLRGAGLPDDTQLPALRQPDAALIQAEVRRAKQTKRQYGTSRPAVIGYRDMVTQHAAQTAKGTT